MQCDEESLHVAIETALPHLVRLDLDEGVVSSLGLDHELHDTQRAGERPRARGGRESGKADRRKEGISLAEDFVRREMRAIEVSHRVTVMELRLRVRCARPDTTPPSPTHAASRAGTVLRPPTSRQ